MDWYPALRAGVAKRDVGPLLLAILMRLGGVACGRRRVERRGAGEGENVAIGHKLLGYFKLRLSKRG
jgi:hypothetical protein